MPPLACVSLPELPLQLAVRRHPEWRELPVAVLTEERPTGIVLHRNRAAARVGVRRGMRYSAALALTNLLRAAVMVGEELSEGIHGVGQLLLGFSPRVEPCAFGDGIFWLDARGLDYLFPSVAAWMDAIRQDLESAGFRARIAAGFTRGGTLVACRVPRADASPLAFASSEEERAFCLGSALRVLPLDQDARRRLAGLGIRTIESFLTLPAGGVRMRLGPEAAQLHQLLAAPPSLPLQPLERSEELVLHRRFDDEVVDTAGLEPSLEEALRAITGDAERRGVRIRELVVTMSVEDGPARQELIRPSEPTAAFGLLWNLLRLRIASVFPGQETGRRCGVVGFTMSAERCRASDEQIELIRSAKSRDRGAGARAFALIRAELGNDAVLRACIRPEHPPERQYSWELIGEPPPPAPPPPVSHRTLVRRIYESPRPLPALGRPPRAPRYRSCGGPYTLSGSWWSQPYSREYRFIEAADGTVLWIFRDGGSAQWMVHGLLR